MKKEIYVTCSSMPSYEKYCQAIYPLWESRWLTNMGKYHEELEKKLSDYLDVPRVSLMVNGHMALELALQSFDFPEGSEVITTPFTFVSSTHAIVRNGLFPIFCDVKESDATIDETKIEELITPKTVAILPVHVYGNVCNVEAIQKIADKYNLKVIYDAAHAFGEKYYGVGIGNFGDVSVFSFHATKVFHTIEGGAVVCNNDDIYNQLYNLKNFGIRDEETVEAVGANAKMNEFCAIMGILNLSRIDETISARERCDCKYRELLEQKKGIRIIKNLNDNIKNNYAYMPITIENGHLTSRNETHEILKRAGIYTRKYFYPTTADHMCFYGKYKDANLKVARDLSDKVLALPIYEELKDEEIERICSYL